MSHITRSFAIIFILSTLQIVPCLQVGFKMFLKVAVIVRSCRNGGKLFMLLGWIMNIDSLTVLEVLTYKHKTTQIKTLSRRNHATVIQNCIRINCKLHNGWQQSVMIMFFSATVTVKCCKHLSHYLQRRRRAATLRRWFESWVGTASSFPWSSTCWQAACVARTRGTEDSTCHILTSW